MPSRDRTMQIIAGVAFLNTPAIVLAYFATSGLISIYYFIPIAWSVLILTTWLFLRSLIDYVGNFRNMFFAIYFPESAIFTLMAFLRQITSFNERAALVLSFITILAYLIPVGIIIKAGKQEMKKECFPDETLTGRLRELTGKNHGVAPEVCIMPIPNYGKSHVITQEIKARRVLITRELIEMLSRDEMDSTLCYASYLAKSHGAVKSLFTFFTPYVALADVFFYLILGGFPGLGLILVPVTGVLLILGVVLFPILLPTLLVRFTFSPVSAADRFAIRTTGNIDALLSALDKIQRIQGSQSISHSKLVGKLVISNEKRYRKRIVKIEKMKSKGSLNIR
ncbi:MAG: hypothetical protein B2I17_02275 [Thermoplasmatales archaeon B_DKE]|nr:MAG: hypothetical protein B2I17_02275 [Thermoplasmatales archaeon B_DKE]